MYLCKKIQNRIEVKKNLSGPAIENATKPPLSDAGKASPCRRRDLCRISFLCVLKISFLLCFWSSPQSSRLYPLTIMFNGDNHGARFGRGSPKILSPIQSVPTFSSPAVNLEEPSASDTSSSATTTVYIASLRSREIGSILTTSYALSHRISSPAMKGGADLIVVKVPRVDHFSRQLGHDPSLFSSRPNSLWCIPLMTLQKPTVCFKLSLFYSRSLCRFKDSIDSGSRLDASHASLLCWYNFYLRTWPLESPRSSTHYLQSLKMTLLDSLFFQSLLNGTEKHGIMTPSPRSGGYRGFSNPLALYSLIFECIRGHLCNFRKNYFTLAFVKLRSVYSPYVLSRLQALCGILNLHGVVHVRKNPPAMLLLFVHIQRILTLVLPSFLRVDLHYLKDYGYIVLHPPCMSLVDGVGSLSIDHSSSNSSDACISYPSTTAPLCYALPKLTSQSTAALATILRHVKTFILARVFPLVQVSFTSLTLSSTPLSLMTVANRSSIDSLLEELSTNFDLTCTTKLLCFWLKALKDPLLFNLMYPSILLIVALGISLFYCALNSGILASSYLCIWVII